MALGYARMEYVQRSKSKTPVSKAAYIAKTSLYFEGNCILPERHYDWSKSPPPMSHTIILPSHVDKSFYDPQVLWNCVEQNEKRKDAQVGKEIVIALPDDDVISDSQRIEMAERFAKKYFVSNGYGVQVNVHHPKKQENINELDEEDHKFNKNYHAHILVTERHFDKNGKGFASKKVNHLGPEVRGSAHATFGGIEWGKHWTQFQNEYFEEMGLDLRVDSPGLVAQIHLGPLRMRTKRAYEILGEFEKREELGKLLALEPKIILQKLTENKSTFQKSDFLIFLQKYVSNADREKINNSFWKSEYLVRLFDKETGRATPEFTSIEVYEEERKILRLADSIVQKKKSLEQITRDPSKLNSEQLGAFKEIVNGRFLSCIEGLAGTGKSYLLVELKNHYESNGYRVRAFGPDNATVKVLKEKGFEDACSVHSILFKNYFSKKNNIIKGKEVWIVDEASKLGNKPLLECLKIADSNNIQLIFCGNSAQLSSVERGGFFSVFCKRFGCSFLEQIQRHKDPIHKEITKHLAYGEVHAAIDKIDRTGGFIWKETKEESLLSLIEKWAEDTLHFPYDSTSIMAVSNKEVRLLNDLAHTVRMARGEVSDQEYECQTTRGKIRVSEGDLIEFRENDKELNVRNGQRGVLIKASEQKFVVKVGENEISFDPNKFAGFQLAYAISYFRSQGETILRTYISYSPRLSTKLLYVGVSRHIKNVYCFLSRYQAKCLTTVKKRMLEAKEPENTLKYTTLEEIDKEVKIKHREKKIQELCSSGSFLSKTKGYSAKAFDFVKSSISQHREKTRDRHANKNFYNISNSNNKSGKVTRIEGEEKLLLKSSEKFNTEKLQVSQVNKNIYDVNTANDSQGKVILQVKDNLSLEQILKKRLNIEKMQDRQSNEDFHDVRTSSNQEKIIALNAEKLLPKQNLAEIPRVNKTLSEKSEKPQSPRSTDFKKLPEESKGLYRKYFDKVGVSSSLYTVVKAEASASAVQKEYAPSFSAWQRTCKERNEAAHELLKMGINHRGVLGEKGYQILKDRAETHNNRLQPKEPIQSQLLNNFENLLYKLFPEGPFRKDARGFRFGSKGSMSVTCAGEKKGCFFNFETRESGNLLTLIEKQCGLSKQEAIAWAQSFLKDYSDKTPPSHFSTERFARNKEDKWISSIAPEGASVPKISSISPYIESKYHLTATHTYYNAEGKIACYNLRLEDKENGKKLILPLSFGKNQGEENSSWRLKGYSQKNDLLYNSQFLQQYPNKSILIVEGEKTADAALKILGDDYVVVSWLGGAGAAKEANWNLLNGRDIVIWPDNDIHGFKAGSDIADCLRRIGVKSLKVVEAEILKGLPLKWDLADALPEGKDFSFIEDTILRANSKAVGLDRLEPYLKDTINPKNEIIGLNEILWRIDERMRPALEAKFSTQTWEIENEILREFGNVLNSKNAIIEEFTKMNLSPSEEVVNKSLQIMAKTGEAPTIEMLQSLKKQEFSINKDLEKEKNTLVSFEIHASKVISKENSVEIN